MPSGSVSNDVLDITNNSSLTPAQQQADVGAAVQNEVSVISGMAAHGAQNMLVLNVPDLGKTPYETARGPAVAQSATSLASLYDSELATALQPLEASGALKIDLVNTFSVIDQAIANPGAYGFTNVTDPLWSGGLTSSSSGTLAASWRRAKSISVLRRSASDRTGTRAPGVRDRSGPYRRRLVSDSRTSRASRPSLRAQVRFCGSSISRIEAASSQTAAANVCCID